MIVSRKAVSGTIQSALITPDGRDVLMATFRNVPSGGNRGTVIAQIAEVSAAGSGPVRVLRTETARYTVNTEADLDDTSQVLSLDPTGRTAGFSASSSAGWTLTSGGSRPCRLQSAVWGVW